MINNHTLVSKYFTFCQFNSSPLPFPSHTLPMYAFRTEKKKQQYRCERQGPQGR